MTEKFYDEQIEGLIVNSVTGPHIDNTDPKNPILPEFVLKAVYDLAMLNKADIDGGGTTGGVWYQDTILSDLFPNYKQVIRVLGGQMAIEYGNVELDVHRFVVTSVSGLKVKVGSAEYTVFHTGNFNPEGKANTDGSNATGALAATIANNHTHTNKSVIDSITAQDLIDWDTASAQSHNALTLGANSAGIDLNTATQRLQFQNGYQLPTTIKLGEYDEAFLLRHSHGNKSVLDNLTQSVIDNAHTHGNKVLLDSYNQTNADISAAVSLRHSHINKAVLDAITAAYTTADKNTLDALAGIQLEADQANALIHVKDGNGNVLSTLNVAFLNNEGTTFVYNPVTNALDLKNDYGQTLSSIPVSSFVTNLVSNANWNGTTPSRLDFKDNAGTILFSIDYTIANVQGLQTALDGKAFAFDNALAIGFNGGNDLDLPYFYHSSDTYVYLATRNWVNSNFATITSLNNKANVDGSNITNPALWRTNLSVYSISNVDSLLNGKANLDGGNITNPNNWKLTLGYLTSETDPIFTASPAYVITSGNITSWNAKQNQLTNGLHTAYNANKIDVSFDVNTFVKDKSNNDRLLFGNTSSTDVVIHGAVANGDFKVKDSTGADMFRMNGSNKVPYFPQLPAPQTMDGNLAIFDTGDGLWKHTTKISDLVTTSVLNSGLSTKANVNGNNLTNIVDWRNNLGVYSTTQVDGFLAGKANTSGYYSGLSVGNADNSGAWNGEIYNSINKPLPTAFMTFQNGTWGYSDVSNMQSVLGINTSWDLQQVATNGNTSTLPIVIQGTEFRGNGIYSPNAFSIHDSIGNVQLLLTGGILASWNYSDASLVPNEGIYSKGTIATGSHGTSADWNAKVSQSQLANYALLTQVYTQAQVNTLLNNKVDKVAGKQLSTEDYTSAEKAKLAGIQAGAEVNVNADWNATSGDAQILNKPTIPNAPNNGTFTVQGDGVDIIGSGSTSADASVNTSSILSLSAAVKSDIEQGIEANLVIPSIIEGVDFFNISSISPQTITIQKKKTIINVTSGLLGGVINVDDGLYDGYELAINGCDEWQVELRGNIQDKCRIQGSTSVNSSVLFWWVASMGQWVEAT